MKRTLDVKSESASDFYAGQATMTIGELHKQLGALLKKYGPDYQVRVNSSYDQGQNYMAITGIRECSGYIGVDA